MNDVRRPAAAAMARGPELVRTDASKGLVASIEARVAEYSDGRVWSWHPNEHRRCESRTHLWSRSSAVAAGLLAGGVTTGRPVVLLVRDVVDFVPAFWGCLRAGGMAVPLTGLGAEPVPDRRNAALGEVLSRLDDPVILFDSSFSGVADALRAAGVSSLPLAEIEASPPLQEERRCSEPVCLIPTSGSTGRTKLVALGQETMLNRYFQALQPNATRRQAGLTLFPFDGISGVGIAFAPGRDFAHLPLAEFAARPLSLFDAIEQLRIDNVGLSNSLAAFLLRAAEKTDRGWDLRSLQMVGVGAEPVVPAVMQRLREQLRRHGASSVKVIAGYGTTETGPLVAGADTERVSPAASADDGMILGKCNRGVALRIVGEDGEVVAEGEVGEVQAVRPGAMFSGYWGEPELTQAGFTADGWWRTGDLGSLRDDELTLRGRTKEIVIVNGKKHSLVDVDAHLQSEFGVGVQAYSCAVLLPDEPIERLVIVFVGTGTIEDDGTIAARIRVSVGRRFGLQASTLVSPSLAAFPVTGAGKIRRQELAQRVRAGAFATAPATARATDAV